jgi:ADP-heptose:LPS heptosyltransferase
MANELQKVDDHGKCTRSALIFSKTDFLNEVFEILFGYCRDKIRILEVYDCLQIYKIFESRMPVIFINNRNPQEIIKHVIQNNEVIDDKIPDDYNDYKCAFLIEAFEGYEKQGYLFPMEEFLSEGYDVSENLFIYKNHMYFIYGKNKNNKDGVKAALIPYPFGFGATILYLPLLQYFLKNTEDSMDIIHVNYKSYEILSRFIKDCNHIMYSCNKSMKDFFICEYGREGKYVRTYNAMKVFRNNPKSLLNMKHVVDVLFDLYSIRKTMDELLAESKIDLSLTPEKVLKKIDKLRRKYKWVIGLQSCTDTIIIKNWPEEHAVNFIKKCHENNIGVINLAPTPYKLHNTIDFSSYKIYQLFGAIKKIDMVIGIDSCFGHVASFLGIPSLTIWGHSSPISFNGCNSSYRAIRMNYSISDRNGNIKRIDSDIVFSSMLDILNGKIELKKDCISYEDTLNGCYVKWL